MKYILSLFIILTLSISSIAEIKREGNIFSIEQTSSKANDIKTELIWKDKEGNRYPIFITKKGACYVLKVSKKTGKEYKYYLPKEVQEVIKKELNIQ